MPYLKSRLRTRGALALAITLTIVGAAGTGPRAVTAPEKGTEILWDTFGIPHIFAPDYPSLFHAYGYAQMEGHAELLVRLYAQARGRGAELFEDLNDTLGLREEGRRCAGETGYLTIQ